MTISAITLPNPMLGHIKKVPIRVLVFIVITAVAMMSGLFYHSTTLSSRLSASERKQLSTQEALKKTKQTLEQLQHEDQYQVNQRLNKEIQDINATYKASVDAYEKLLTLQEKTNRTDDLEKSFATILSLLAEKNYASASGELKNLNAAIQKQEQQVASSFSIPQNVPSSNTPPSGGYARQSVNAAGQAFLVDIISADLNTAKVIVDTASSSDCANDCPVMALGEYAARSGAFAAINGPYFCPASYPSCADKKNSFDTLLMNKDKTYFNSANNVYSTVPAVIFSGSSARFVGRSLEWGRDTGVDAVIASQPMLVSGGESVFGGDSEAKRSGKGSRSFIGASGSTVYIGVVHNATAAEVAQVLKAMGVQNALNLDSGGSTALWSSGKYLVGPGRALPFGILLVRR